MEVLRACGPHGPMNRVWLLLLPGLRELRESEREQALRAAREARFDALELVGMACALVAVTALTRYAVPPGSLSLRFGSALLNFLVAVPLLALAMAPFQWRRLRRGLRQWLQARGGRA